MRKNMSGSRRGFDRVHRLAEQMRVGADVQLDVVAGRLDPVDLVGAHEEDAAARLDDEAIDARLAPASDPGRARCRRRSRSPPVAALELLARARERLPEPLAIERLEQVVERVHVERAQRVAIVGGDEDHERHPVGADRVDHVEAVGIRASARRGTPGRATATRSRRPPCVPSSASPTTSHARLVRQAASAAARARAARRRRSEHGSGSVMAWLLTPRGRRSRTAPPPCALERESRSGPRARRADR